MKAGDRPLIENPRPSGLCSIDLQRLRLRRLEDESGFGEEAVDAAGAVLHPFEPGLHQAVSSSRLTLRDER